MKFKLKNNKRKIALALLIAAALSVLAPLSPSENTIRHKVVKLSGQKGMCSGEQIQAPSGASYILTAAHCRQIAINDVFTVTNEDGHSLKRRVIAEDPASDLLLVEGLPNVKGLEIASWAPNDIHVRSYTHGGNMPTFRTDGYLVEKKEIQILVGLINTAADDLFCTGSKYQRLDVQGWFGEKEKVCVLDVIEEVTTASVIPGSSGGPMVNDEGQLIGVVSASGGGFGYLITLSDIHSFLSGY